MPKLIVNRPKKKRPLPPGGRGSDFTVPHSPFQLLVDSKRQHLGLSTRQLAFNISDLLPATRPIAQSVLWFWLHQRNGAPHPRALTTERMNAIAKCIGVTIEELKDSIDASRLLFNPGQIPVPQPSVDGLDSLIEILKNDKRRSIYRETILNLARNIRAGCRDAAQEPPK